MKKIRIVIVEDLEEVAEGLAEFIQRDDELQLMASFRTAEAASLEIPILKPDVAVVDINLPGVNGIECIRRVKEVAPSVLFMMFTVYENNEHVFEALRVGASGYLLKRTPPAEIISAIKELYHGGSPMSSSIARKLVVLFQNQNPSIGQEGVTLTRREKEVLEQLAKGMLYKEIGEQLGISFHTVRQHIAKIYEKLHVQNKTEAINKVFRNKM
jgi:DNA-binding NarL/FixJ family response regulator